MRYYNQQLFRSQFEFLRRQFLQDGEFAFADILSRETDEQALDTIEFAWNERIYTPLVTLWIFLGQVISADHSCRSAVARFVAHRLARGDKACSSHAGAYCQARKRLPEKFFAMVTQLVGRTLDAKVKEDWLWKGRRVFMFDGSSISMPDTEANQAEYPQTWKSKPGAGFPFARIGVLASLSCGAILDMTLSSYTGKGTGEVSLLRRMWHILKKGDVLLADSLMCNWRNLYELSERGIPVVTLINKALRKADFRKGTRLGPDDHLVQWPKKHIRDVGRAAQLAMPRFLTVREVRFRVERPGFRSQEIVVVTTLLDAVEYSKEDLAELYRSRWNQELDLRSIKTTMQMDVLRCKTPELVRKEIWTHFLAYNLIRTIMAQAAVKHDLAPRTISFKATMQLLEAFQPLLSYAAKTRRSCEDLRDQLLSAIANHRVGNRPDRTEPRKKKRRRMPYDLLNKPRAEAKLDILKGLR
ncbi:MAG: IS4 family transposase [Planctomycetales bacterium]|nr:IS4 family transposase [Planctomycetales bacterium]